MVSLLAFVHAGAIPLFFQRERRTHLMLTIAINLASILTFLFGLLSITIS
jgi:hypothetical protein